MKLFEFFGRPINASTSKEEKDKGFKPDDIFFFILNNDDLHREHFFPLAKKIKKTHGSSSFDKNACVKEFMQMVNKGCKKYYEEKKLFGHLKDRFPKELREEICEKLYEHFYEDIIKDNYNLGL